MLRKKALVGAKGKAAKKQTQTSLKSFLVKPANLES